MRYAQIREMDISNGIGIGTALFVQGCKFHCKNCFNKNTWDFSGGSKWTTAERTKFLNLCSLNYITRISILGGEPLTYENLAEVTSLCKELKNKCPNKTIWVYTGYLFEDIKNYEILKYIDVLVDGQYIDKLKNINLKFKGSSNQRIIDVQETLRQQKVIEFHFDD